MSRNRRALVLSNDGARHPFRRTLPAHVFVPLADDGVAANGAMTREDWRAILTAYCSVFVIVLAWIA